MFNVTFLGVRGSTPCASSPYMRYGGHTSCVMVELDNKLVFFDAGSGLYDANKIVGDHPNKEIELLFSHVHLDHVLGLPFFGPVWNPNFKLNIHAGTLAPYGGLEHFLSKTFSAPLFPVEFKNFTGNITCHDFSPGSTLQFNEGYEIQTLELNHPNGAVGMRLNYKDRSVCYITDNEHTPGVLDEKIVHFIKDTDLFIYDSSYSDDYFAKHKGWGHSTWQEAIRLGEAAFAKRIAVFHHDPLNTDDKNDMIAELVKERSDRASMAIQGETVVLL